jgi:hypothetical protein
MRRVDGWERWGQMEALRGTNAELSRAILRARALQVNRPQLAEAKFACHT